MSVRFLQQHHRVLKWEPSCAGYVDGRGKWNSGLQCPLLHEGRAVYCCGTDTYRYCCQIPPPPVTTTATDDVLFTISTTTSPLTPPQNTRLDVLICLLVGCVMAVISLIFCFLCVFKRRNTCCSKRHNNNNNNNNKDQVYSAVPVNNMDVFSVASSSSCSGRHDNHSLYGRHDNHSLYGRHDNGKQHDCCHDNHSVHDCCHGNQPAQGCDENRSTHGCHGNQTMHARNVSVDLVVSGQYDTARQAGLTGSSDVWTALRPPPFSSSAVHSSNVSKCLSDENLSKSSGDHVARAAVILHSTSPPPSYFSSLLCTTAASEGACGADGRQASPREMELLQLTSRTLSRLRRHQAEMASESCSHVQHCTRSLSQCEPTSS